MKKIVQKFGGTSLDTEEKRKYAVEHIKEVINEGYLPLVIVSAMGRAGKPYATDTLIKMAESIDFDIRPRERDLLMSCGEIISAVVMVQTLNSVGIKAVALTGAQAGIITDSKYGESEITRVELEKILEIIKKGEV